VEKYLDFIKANDYWEEDAALAHVRVILNSHLAEPPASFTFEGKTLTPREFLKNVLSINPDDYVDVMSTLSFPFYTQGPFEVPDNWWFDSAYYNLPLDEWYNTITGSIRSGFSVELGGDVSEPGWYGKQDLAVVPDFDLPGTHINQDSREFRFYNRTTTDDHGIHLVGYTTVENRDWFLLKDSGRSARHGKHEGYFFMRDDFLRLKMLTFTVHRDALGDIFDRFPKRI
jgi:bleomycin hydrolase